MAIRSEYLNEVEPSTSHATYAAYIDAINTKLRTDWESFGGNPEDVPTNPNPDNFMNGRWIGGDFKLAGDLVHTKIYELFSPVQPTLEEFDQVYKLIVEEFTVATHWELHHCEETDERCFMLNVDNSSDWSLEVDSRGWNPNIVQGFSNLYPRQFAV